MNTRERFQAVLNFEKPDRLPVIEWAPWWHLTLENWRKQGLPAGFDTVGLQEHFGLDLMVQSWIRPTNARTPEVPHGNPLVRDLAEYEQLRASRAVHDLDAVDFEPFERYREQHERGDAVFWFTLDGFFWFPRNLFGIENHLYAFYDQPELMKRLNQDQLEFNLKVLDRIFDRYEPEFMSFAEDMSYNHGSMISEELFDEFLLPYYREIIPVLRKHNVKVFLDSDGDITGSVSWFERAGIDGIFPLERQAGVDVARLRREHPKFLLLGGYDKMVMDKGEEAIEREFARLLPTARQSGFLVSCDHQTPPAVTLDDYALYLKAFREFAAEACR